MVVEEDNQYSSSAPPVSQTLTVKWQGHQRVLCCQNRHNNNNNNKNNNNNNNNNNFLQIFSLFLIEKGGYFHFQFKAALWRSGYSTSGVGLIAKALEKKLCESSRR